MYLQVTHACGAADAGAPSVHAEEWTCMRCGILMNVSKTDMEEKINC